MLSEIPYKTRTSRGFTVIELMIVLVLVASLIIGSFLYGNQGVQRADSGAYARRMMSALRACRQQAITEGQPVAFVLPSDSGSRPHSQSYYLASGHRPRVTEVTNLVGEHPNICASVPVLGENAFIDRGQEPTNGESFDLASWVITGGLEDEFVFCFTSDGRLLTNDLPLNDGEYHILVSAGLEYSGAAQPTGAGWGVGPSNYSTPTAVSSPKLISLSPNGQIDLSALDSSLNISELDSLGFQQAPAQSPTLSTPGSNAPTVESVEVFPVPDPALVPPGLEALVDVEGHLTLKVVARDQDAERKLYCT